jgi:hypothetical protein
MAYLPVHSYQVDTAASGRLVNVYAEAAPVEVPQGKKAPMILHRAPGIRTVSAVGAGPGRGLHAMKGQLFSVSGSALYRNFDATAVGAVLGSGRAYLSDNGTQLAVVTDAQGYVYQDGGLAQITDPDFTPGPCIFASNYLLGIRPGTGQFFTSDLADFTNFDGLDFATAEAEPDNLVVPVWDHKQVLLLGETTGELWVNTGRSGFPWEDVTNGIVQSGCVGPRAAIAQDQSIFWLADDVTLRRLNGNTPVRVSQHGAERKWREYSRVDDCEFSKYSVDGHLCVVLRFPTANATWVYDCTTQELFEREGRRFAMWDVSDITVMNGVTYVQRASTGEIGILDPKCYTQWGETMRAEWTYQNIYNSGDPFTLGELEIGIETGVGNGDEPDPHLTLELSYDGGISFTHTMPTRPIGKKGQRREKVLWGPCGYGTDIVPRLSLAEAVPLTLWDTQYSVD